jgi:hypothetical protein
MHSNLARWIEDADAREVLLQSTTTSEPQRVSQHQYIHLGQTIKKVISWWHHDGNGHTRFSDHRQGVVRH